MFRKIHSNRDPQDTILSQLKTEFAPYFEKSSVALTQKLQKRPRFILAVMITAIVLSAGLSFTVFRNKEPAETGKGAKHAKEKSVNVISDAFNQIGATANAIQQTIQLKKQIDSLSAKKTLSKQDSDNLENELDQLRHLNQPSKP